MNIHQVIKHSTKLLVVIATGFILSACQSTPEKDPALEQVRADLTTLQSDPQLSSLAQTAIQDAERAVRAAEEPREDKDLTSHLIYVAGNKVKVARAQASARFQEDQLDKLGEKRQQVQLDARTLEAQRAAQRASSLEQELADIKQKQTDRGTVFTLGDALFSTGKSDLKPGSQANFDRLATLLNQQQNRKVVIEGHTDSVGSDEFNQSLSQQRADAVRTYLTGHGVAADRVTAVGKGEGFPVATNDTASGRQQNRRVEVIIENPAAGN